MKLTMVQFTKNAVIPHKNSRIKIENINREIKIFRICKEISRHKQKKHNLFWNLIAGVVKFIKPNQF